MQKLINFKKKEVKYIRIFQDLKKIVQEIHKNAAKKAILKVELLSAPEIYFMIKVTFFQKN
jgi:hypothetical protein